jgi:hypothetical protein
MLSATCGTVALAQQLTTPTLAIVLQPTTITLSSAEECDTKFARWFVTAPKSGVQFFLGQTQDRLSKGETGKSLWRFDSTKLEVSPVVPADSWVQMGAKDIWELSVDEQRRLIAITPSRTKENGGIITDILVIDAQRGDLLFRLADGQRNFSPCFSPDGRYLAFFSTDSNMQLDPEAVILNCAGRVLDLSTKKVTTLADPFPAKGDWGPGAPSWLDSERVLFSTMCGDKTIIAQQVKGFAGDKCPCVVLAYCPTGKLKRLMMPLGKATFTPLIFLDPKRQRIVVSDNTRQIVQTDYDLENRKIVIEVDDTKRLSAYGVREDGIVSYKVRENVPVAIPRSLY